MRHSLKKLFCFVAALVCAVSSAPVSEAEEVENGKRAVTVQSVTESYTYNNKNNGAQVVSSPDTYLPKYIVDSDSLGTELLNPSHITSCDGKLYIVNTGKNNIIITDDNFRILDIVDSFDNNGKVDGFAAPQGCYVTADGLLYIADTDNHRVVVLDSKFKLVQIVGQPESDVLADDFVFKPQKIVVDSSKRFFVVSDGVYEGIMQFYENGTFIGFIGSIPVTASPLEIIWKKILSKEQNAKRSQFVPVSYTNIFLDSEEFIYTVSLSSTLTNPIRRLNLGGGDVLIRNSLAGIGVDGDQIGVTSQFVAICADESNTYYVADSKQSRIFIYDEDGNLLNVFGGKYTGQVGTYKHISSLLLYGDELFVVDSQTSIITALYPTDYMLALREGLYTYRIGMYDESAVKWQDVLSYNSNFDLAYSKLGMIKIRNKEYNSAMEYFKLANDQKNYSKAYVKYRSEWYSENLSIIITVLLVAVISIVALRAYIKRRRARKIEK